MGFLNSFVDWANGYIWGIGMLVIIVGTGLVFTVGLGFFQFVHFGDMWKRIFDKNDSESGVSTFASFCTTMAMRIGTGNVAGVAVALHAGGPGAMFWMILAGMTNSAVCFVETTLSSAYKYRIDGEYRGGGPYCAERGLGWKPYGVFMAVVFGFGVALFMPAAATYTICDGFNNATGLPMWVISLVIAVIFAITVIGGIKRISQVASMVVPFMTAAYLIITLIIIVTHITAIPGVIKNVFQCAFSASAVFGGGVGVAIQQGVKRGTFSSAAGMGEASPTAAAAETSHPVKQGMANAAGVWLDTVIVCTCSGLMMLLTDCFNTAGGYVGSGSAKLAEMAAAGQGGGVQYVQLAVSTVVGSFGNILVAFMLLLFSFTCLISYYYEAETSIIYLFQGEGKEKTRKMVTRLMQIIMPILIFIWGIIESSTAWNLSDLALGACTWINVFMLWFLFPKARKLYVHYEKQMKAGIEPYYDPAEVGEWKGIDVAMWQEINAKQIAEHK